jgi:hypothetical protein
MDKKIEQEIGFIADRLDTFITFCGMSRRSFAESVGVLQQAMNRQIKERKGFSSKTIVGVALKYKMLNMNWLIRGAGDMIIGKEAKTYKQILSENGQSLKERDSRYDRIIAERVEEIRILKEENAMFKNVLDALLDKRKEK